MNLNIVVPGMLPDRFTAGMYAIAQYANGLIDRGHQVNLLSAGASFQPTWTELKAHHVDPNPPSIGRLAAPALRTFTAYGRRRLGKGTNEDVMRALTGVVLELGPWSDSLPVQRGTAFERVRRRLPRAEITIATAWNTVAPVYLYGSGELVHYMQHYEPYFADEYEDPVLARAEAELAYRLPLHRVANVTWVSDLVNDLTGVAAPVCWAGIDHEAFYPDGSPPRNVFRVLTYGGQQRRWKGFPEAAEAVRLARERIPNLEWLVYGEALLPPDNPIAPYIDAGFVTGRSLRRLYSSSHVTLCPSWYEGFPYPPTEAMACGSAVVATPRGAGDIGRDGENAVLVPPQDPQALAAALVRLWQQPQERATLVKEGLATVQAFTWRRSIDRFEELLQEIVAKPSVGSVNR